MALGGIRHDFKDKGATPDRKTAPLFTAPAGGGGEKSEPEKPIQVMASGKLGVYRPKKLPPWVGSGGKDDIFPKGSVPSKVYPTVEDALKSANLSPKAMNELLQKIDPDLRPLPVAKITEGKFCNNFYIVDAKNKTIQLTQNGADMLQEVRAKQHQPPVRRGDKTDLVWLYLEQERKETEAGKEAVRWASGLPPGTPLPSLPERPGSRAQSHHGKPPASPPGG